MERKNFIKGLVLGGASLSMLSACNNNDNPAKEADETTAKPYLRNGLIVHSVYFWLKEDISAEEEQDFLKFFAVLGGIPEVEYLTFGKPAPTNPREVVDNSFSCHLLVFFKSMEDINIYETHPDHIAGAEQYGKYWTHVEVRDSIVG